MNSASRKESLSTEGNRSTEATKETTEQEADSARDELPLDVVFGALKNARRRRVLQYLGEQGESVRLSDLAEHVAAVENDTTPDKLDSKQRKRVYVGLYQSHLPKLDDISVISFDQDRGVIELGPAASQLEQYLYPEPPDVRPWHHHYLGFLVVSGLALLVGTGTGVVAIGAAAVLFAAIGIGLASLAALHAYDQRS